MFLPHYDDFCGLWHCDYEEETAAGIPQDGYSDIIFAPVPVVKGAKILENLNKLVN